MSRTGTVTRLRTPAVAIGTALLLPLTALTLRAAPATQTADVISLVSRNDGRPVTMHVEARGERCWAVSSDDDTVGVAIGDDLCGMTAEVDGASSLRVRLERDRLVFSRGGRSYVITDAATVERARGLFAPLMAIAGRQAELGREQRQLGERQRDFGRQQREMRTGLDARELDGDLEQVKARFRALARRGATPQDLEDLQTELGALQMTLAALQLRAGGQQERLASQQARLGSQQTTYGQQQMAFEREARQMIEGINASLRPLLDTAIHDGLARPE